MKFHTCMDCIHHSVCNQEGIYGFSFGCMQYSPRPGLKENRSIKKDDAVTEYGNSKKERDYDVLQKSESLKDLIAEVAKIDASSSVDQRTYIIEECSELIRELSDMIKALTKEKRGKGGADYKVFEEACDVVATIFIMLYQREITWGLVEDQIKSKYKKVLFEYYKKGEAN